MAFSTHLRRLLACAAMLIPDGVSAATDNTGAMSSKAHGPLVIEPSGDLRLWHVTAADGRVVAEPVTLRPEAAGASADVRPSESRLRTLLDRLATRVRIITGPAGWQIPLHTVPAGGAELVLILQGEAEMDLPGSPSLHLDAGTLVLFEDHTGPGHGGTVGPHGFTALTATLSGAPAR